MVGHDGPCTITNSSLYLVFWDELSHLHASCHPKYTAKYTSNYWSKYSSVVLHPDQ